MLILPMWVLKFPPSPASQFYLEWQEGSVICWKTPQAMVPKVLITLKRKKTWTLQCHTCFLNILNHKEITRRTQLIDHRSSLPRHLTLLTRTVPSKKLLVCSCPLSEIYISFLISRSKCWQYPEYIPKNLCIHISYWLIPRIVTSLLLRSQISGIIADI